MRDLCDRLLDNKSKEVKCNKWFVRVCFMCGCNFMNEMYFVKRYVFLFVLF